MMDNRESTRKRIVLVIIASAFSILIVAENVPHAAHSLLTIFSAPPEPQISLIVGAYVFLPLALLWATSAVEYHVSISRRLETVAGAGSQFYLL